MGCVASTDKKDAESMAIAERIVDITWAQHDQDGNGVLDMNEVRAYVHANVAQMNKKGMLIDN